MPIPIQTLINKQDSAEIVRDQIAQILANEVANQMALATTAGEDPADWDMRIYTERQSPWEAWLNADSSAGANVDPAPIVNVQFDSDAAPKSRGNVVAGQVMVGTFWVDCYGLGITKDDGGTGHIPGDKASNLEAQRAARLVRNIIMSANYTYLQTEALDLRALRIVEGRWLESRTALQVPIDSRTAQHVHAVRLVFEVKYCEQAPQITGDVFDCIHIDLKRSDDGFVLAQLEYGDGCIPPEPPAFCSSSDGQQYYDDTRWTPFGFFWDATETPPVWEQTQAFGNSVLEPLGGWDTPSFRPTHVTFRASCKESTYDTLPSSADFMLWDTEGNMICSAVQVYTVVGQIENTGPVAIDWGNSSPTAVLDRLEVGADSYMLGPNISCIQFEGV